MANKADFKFKNKKKFMDNLNREVQALNGRTQRGLIEAAIVLQREAEPETPIDEGNLRASWFIVSVEGAQSNSHSFEGEGARILRRDHTKVLSLAKALVNTLSRETQPIVMFGYSANYAPFVHEHVDANFKRTGARARWLYAAMQRSKDKMLEKIRQHAKF